MHKCWNCGTEHDINDMESYIRGKNAAIERIKSRLLHEICEEECNMCEGIRLSISIINDEFGLNNDIM